MSMFETGKTPMQIQTGSQTKYFPEERKEPIEQQQIPSFDISALKNARINGDSTSMFQPSYDISGLKKANETGDYSEILKQPERQYDVTRDSLPAKIARDYVAGASGFGDSATLGILPTLLKQDNPEMFKTITQIQEENPIATGVGKFAGYAVPGFGTAKALSKVPLASKMIPSLSDKAIKFIGKSALTGGTEASLMGAAEGALEGIREDKPILETAAKRAGTDALFGLGLGAGFGSIAKGVSKVIPKIKNIFSKSDANIGQNKPMFDEGNIKPLQNKNDGIKGDINAKNSNIRPMNPDDFNSIGNIDDLPNDMDSLRSYIAEAERRIKLQEETGLKLMKVNLQLFAEAQKKLTRLQKNVQRFNELEDLVETSDDWKDKSQFSFSREAPIRNFEEVGGEKYGKKLKDTIYSSIPENEAKATKMKNEYRDRIRKLDLSKKESELTQKLGEGKITLDDLKELEPDSWPKIKTAVDEFRNIYDELIKKANETLKRNFYDEVPYRKDYFPHFEGEDDIMSQLGFNIRSGELPTDIAGVTAEFRPGKKWFANFLERKGDQTTFDAVQGFDRYLDGISHVIHHTDDIQKLRTFIELLGNKYKGTTRLNKFVTNLQEYTNNLAGKKAQGDRGFEGTFGRKMYDVIDSAKKRLGSNMVAVNVSSWMTNTIPLLNATAENNKSAVAKALLDTFKSITGNDGFIQKSNFLTNRYGSDPLFLTGVQKASKALTSPFAWIDRFVSQAVTRAKYYDAISKGVPESEALNIADEWAGKTIGDRSVGSQPTLFNQKNPLISLFTQFQLEVNNQLSHIFKDLPKEYSKPKLASVATQLLVYDYLFNNLFEEYTGNRPAFDPLGVVISTVSDLGNKKLPASRKASNIVQNVTRQLPFVGSFVGGGRIPISAAIPDATKFTSGESTLKELKKPLYYLLPPTGGGQLKKSLEGLKAYSEGGVYRTDAKGKKKKLYSIKRTPLNLLRAGIFGKSSLPESKKYYDKK